MAAKPTVPVCDPDETSGDRVGQSLEDGGKLAGCIPTVVDHYECDGVGRCVKRRRLDGVEVGVGEAGDEVAAVIGRRDRTTIGVLQCDIEIKVQIPFRQELFNLDQLVISIERSPVLRIDSPRCTSPLVPSRPNFRIPRWRDIYRVCRSGRSRRILAGEE
jgi:hypothetical protein